MLTSIKTESHLVEEEDESRWYARDSSIPTAEDDARRERRGAGSGIGTERVRSMMSTDSYYFIIRAKPRIKNGCNVIVNPSEPMKCALSL